MPTSDALIVKFQDLIGDDDEDARLWSNNQIGEMIEAGFAEYTYGERNETNATVDDITQALKLAFSYAMYELAAGTALFFKWRDQNKDIDKSMTPESCRRIGKDKHAEVIAHRKSKDAGEGEAEKAKAQGGVAQFDAGTTQADRTPERGWR